MRKRCMPRCGRSSRTGAAGSARRPAIGFPERVTAISGRAWHVHGRYREPCPDCGARVQRIRYAANECNYCAKCQTGGLALGRSIAVASSERRPWSTDAGGTGGDQDRTQPLVWCLTNTVMKMRGHFGRRQGAMTSRGDLRSPQGRYHARKLQRSRRPKGLPADS